MALVFMDGCDTAPINAKWRDVYVASYNATGSKFNTAYYGVYQLHHWPAAAPPSTNRLLFGCWVRNSGFTLAVRNYVGTEEGQITTDGAGRLVVKKWMMSTVAGTGTRQIGDGQWHWLELDITYAASGSVKAYVDGVLDIDVSGVDMTGGYTPSVARISFYNTDIDDVVWYNNEAGGLDASSFPLGPSRIDTLRPTSDVTSQFTPSTGSSHYALVDESTIDTADYVESGTATNRDLFGFGDMSFNPASIKTVMLNIYAQNSGGGSISMNPVAKSGSTTSTTPTIALAQAYYTYQKEYQTDPDTSAAWTQSGVNTAQFGVEVA